VSDHRISLNWNRNGAAFERNNYSRDHKVRFQGGQEIDGSSAAGYGGNAAYTDPEQLLLSAISSCHFLTFLAVAANRSYVIDSYDDDASADLGKNEQGQMVVTLATLRPRIRFSGASVPNDEEVKRLHERAHKACFVANSVKTEVRIEPRSD
jgi:organic hydroperoxide reductase OsmC/OhrA